MPSAESEAIRAQIQKQTAASQSPLHEQRRAWLEYSRTLPLRDDIESKEEVIAGVDCLWLSKSGNASGSVIVYLHGGGLVDGGVLTHREFVARLVGITGYQAVVVGYRLMPEDRFPAPLEDVLSVYSALKSDPRTCREQIILGGDSSGGGLAVSAMIRLHENGKELPVCAFALSAVFDMTLSSPSMTNRDRIDPCLSHAALKDWLQYFKDLDPSDPKLSPIFGDIRGLPPTLLQVGDQEIWLDDSIRMAEKARACGGTVDLRIWEGMWHVWHMYSDLPEAREAIEEIGAFIDRHAKRAVDHSVRLENGGGHWAKRTRTTLTPFGELE